MSRIDTFILTVAVLILAIGTASGNAVLMFVVSMVALAIGAVFRRKNLAVVILPAALALIIGAAVNMILFRL